MPDPYSDLKQRLPRGEVCAFVGAGLAAAAGLPDWHDLMAELAASIAFDLPPRRWATAEALLDAAQAYVNQRGLNDLIRFLRDRLATWQTPPSSAHLALARLPVTTIFTTVYDDLLEKAYRQVGKQVDVVVRDSTIPYLRRGPNVVNLIKLNGDLAQPDTLVVTREHYERFRLTRPQMVKLLETELGRSDMLYLGWNQADPAFAFVFGEVLGRFGADMRPGYAALFEVTPTQVDEWRRKNIRPVVLSGDTPADALAAWLTELAEKTSPLGPEPLQGAAVAAAGPSSGGIPTTAPPAAERAALEARLRDLRAYLNGLETARITAGPIEQVKIDLEIEKTRQRLRDLEAELDAAGG
ncbi:MAG: SIR2 family protein [Caldilineales bacterium]|nr:SIR2 family protein [Caldilineales bacterium]